MSEFKVTLARIEAVDEGEQGKQIRAVFHIERDLIGFQRSDLSARPRLRQQRNGSGGEEFTASDVRRARQSEQSLGAFAR